MRITRPGMSKAVLSSEAIESLSARSEALEALTAKFDGLLERMQTPAARKGMQAAFEATPAALGRAAALERTKP